MIALGGTSEVRELCDQSKRMIALNGTSQVHESCDQTKRMIALNGTSQVHESCDQTRDRPTSVCRSQAENGLRPGSACSA
jgi:hypothetical protein